MASSPVHGRLELEVTALPLKQLASLTDDLLEEIFLRITCPADLIRTSAACASFHRLIIDDAFLRCYCSFHPPLLLGFLDKEVSRGFRPVDASHPNAPTARSLANNVFFEFPPLQLPIPDPGCWYVNATDIRDSRVLFECIKLFDETGSVDLVVSDPPSLSRRYLPPLPWDQGLEDFDAAFAPCDDADETSFRVISAMYYETKLMVRVFDLVSGSWTVATSAGWDALSLSN
ncbi:hypothetical protein QOZ80_7AG0571440 [Eleusine coracana subsp. coracana]|nr:hypothetical protein QOZ80_7AG0571440 [Eleusine coracana subsp. coracana]